MGSRTYCAWRGGVWSSVPAIALTRVNGDGMGPACGHPPGSRARRRIAILHPPGRTIALGAAGARKHGSRPRPLRPGPAAGAGVRRGAAPRPARHRSTRSSASRRTGASCCPRWRPRPGSARRSPAGPASPRARDDAEVAGETAPPVEQRRPRDRAVRARTLDPDDPDDAPRLRKRQRLQTLQRASARSTRWRRRRCR